MLLAILMEQLFQLTVVGQLGKGELRNIEELLNTDAIKVLEIWQGHLNNFFGFKEAINFLEKRYS